MTAANVVHRLTYGSDDDKVVVILDIWEDLSEAAREDLLYRIFEDLKPGAPPFDRSIVTAARRVVRP